MLPCIERCRAQIAGSAAFNRLENRWRRFSGEYGYNGRNVRKEVVVSYNYQVMQKVRDGSDKPWPATAYQAAAKLVGEAIEVAERHGAQLAYNDLQREFPDFGVDPQLDGRERTHAKIRVAVIDETTTHPAKMASVLSALVYLGEFPQVATEVGPKVDALFSRVADELKARG
ncbi:MAG: hypothetical protein AB1744_07075 [Candidatus Zixiibacteriota bacterium]